MAVLGRIDLKNKMLYQLASTAVKTLLLWTKFLLLFCNFIVHYCKRKNSSTPFTTVTLKHRRQI